MTQRAALNLAVLLLVSCGGAAESPSAPPREAAAPKSPLPLCTYSAEAYTPRPPPSSPLLQLPHASAPRHPVKVGDAYTVWGASHHLRSRIHHDEVESK